MGGKLHKVVYMYKISGFAVSSTTTSGASRTVDVSVWEVCGCGVFLLIPNCSYPFL